MTSQNNSMENFFLNMMRSGGNPQQMMMEFLSKQNTPFTANLLALAKNGDIKEIEKIAHNICAERGVDFNTEFKNFKQKFGL